MGDVIQFPAKPPWDSPMDFIVQYATESESLSDEVIAAGFQYLLDEGVFTDPGNYMPDHFNEKLAELIDQGRVIDRRPTGR